jgi:glutamine phosphoribosylpyrophosphate amidotransferase
VKGSCSLLLLTKNGIYAARDKLGRTPVVIGKKTGAFAASSESSSFANQPQNQQMRDLVAKMKLIPVRALIEGKKIVFCDDSIVRGTQQCHDRKDQGETWRYYA